MSGGAAGRVKRYQGGGYVTEEEATEWWKKQPAYQGAELTPYEKSGILMVPETPAKATEQERPEGYEKAMDYPGILEAPTMDIEGGEASGTFDIDDRTYILPTQVEGQKFSPEEAIQRFQETGEHLGSFDKLENARFFEDDFLGYVPPQPIGFAKGGRSKDTQPALLSPGEVVLNKEQQRKVGVEKIRKAVGKRTGESVGGVRKYQAGGTVGGTVQMPDGTLINVPDDAPDDLREELGRRADAMIAPPPAAAPAAPPPTTGIEAATAYGQQLGAPTVGEQKEMLAAVPQGIRAPLEAAAETVAGFVPKSLAEATQLGLSLTPGIGQAISTYRAGQAIREGRPLEAAAGIPVAQRIPEIIAAEQTPAFSKERYRAGFGTLADLLMVGGIGQAVARPSARPTLTEELFPETRATETTPLIKQTNQALQQLEEQKYAPQERQVTEGGLPQYRGDETRGTPTETGGGGGVGASAQIGREAEQPGQAAPETVGERVSPLALAEEPTAPPAPPTEAPPATQPGAPQPDVVTGIANKVTEQERATRGLPEAAEPERRSWQQAMDEAQARDAEGPTLVEELKNNPRALNDTEDALLLREQIKAQQAHDAAVKEVNANPADEAAKTRLEAARDRVQTIYDVDKSAGTAGGRGLNARKMLADQDFSLAKMEATIRAEGGGKPLTPDKANKIQKLHGDIQRTEASYQKQIQKGIEEYERRTGEKDISPLRPPRRVVTDPETIRLLHARDKARTTYHDMLAQERFNAAPLYQKIGHYTAELGVGLSRSIKSAYDLSGLLRQGGLIVTGRPIIGAKSVPSMLKSFASEEAQTAAMQDIVSHPKYDRMRHAKLDITEPGGRMSKREEVFRSQLAEKIPGVKASERAYTTVLNKLRSDTFDSLTGLAEKMTGRKLTAAEDRLFANYVNIASGRGNMGRFAAAANAASKVLWSPQLAVSRVQYLLGQPIWGNLKAGGAPAVRALIAAEYARTLTGMGVMVGLARAAGASVELDPRSGNFGIRFGNKRVDITAGLKSYINHFSRIVTNKLKTQKGEIKELGSDIVTPGPVELTARLARGKLAPAWGSAFNVLEGQLPTGEPTTPINELLGFYAPLSPQDVGDALASGGIPEKIGTSLLAIGGMSTQNYEQMTGADKKAIRARLQQRDQALMRGDVEAAYRLSFPSKQPQQARVVNY